MATPRKRRGFTPRPFLIRPWTRCAERLETIRPVKPGDVLTVEFTVMGIPCIGLNAGPAIKHTEAFSFQVSTERGQSRNGSLLERDRWRPAVRRASGGWCKDKWGLSWQITPAVLINAITDPDPAAAKRAFDAMMQMKKIDIAVIEAAGWPRITRIAPGRRKRPRRVVSGRLMRFAHP